jgi:hypothetical protein
MSEFAVQSLLKTPTVAIHDVCCKGSCRHQSAEECTTTTQVVFPYRGVYVRHLGQDQAVAEANQVVFFNTAEGYRVSHPVPGGDASMTLVLSETQLRELRHSLREKIAEPLEAESLALTLVQRALGPRTTHAAAASVGRQRLVDRVKLVLASDVPGAGRWPRSPPKCGAPRCI